MKIEVKTEISKENLKIYQKILFENLYWNISYTIKKSQWKSNLVYILQYYTFFKINLQLFYVSNKCSLSFKKEYVIMGDFFMI